MFENQKILSANKDEFYKMLNLQLEGLLDGESDWLANLANASAHLYHSLETINWAGFYLLRGQELVLGPFQGKIACTRIKIGKGVCGTAVAEKRTQVVADVHQFPGHIPCDSASNSEIVVPIIKDGTLYGVLDIDSPVTERFNETDKKYLEEFIQKLNKAIDWKRITEGMSVKG
jgi:L-methionine (R)-S-oxide reductase